MSVTNLEIDYSAVMGRKVECPDKCGMCCLCQPEVLPNERSFFKTKFPKALIRSDCEDHHPALAMKKGRGSCVFLNNRRCDIYQNRPTFCRQFPYHFYVGERVSVELDLSCRGAWTGRGEDAERQARELAEASYERLMQTQDEAAGVYRSFYDACRETGVMNDPSMIRMSVSENLDNFTNLEYVAKVMDMALEEPRLNLGAVTPGAYDIAELDEAARDAAMGSMGSSDPMSVPVYCDKDWNWNMFMANNGSVEWAVMDDEGDLRHKGFVDVADIGIREPDADGKRVLADYVSILNGRESFLGSVFYNMDQLDYEDDMANSYLGSLTVTIVDLLWRASMLDHFMGTGMGADGIREAIIFYDMDRLDAPTIGAFV
jgi:Fe-S-cluster containining protein